MIGRVAKTIDRAVSIIASRLVDAYRGSLLGINARTRALLVFSKGAIDWFIGPSCQDPVARQRLEKGLNHRPSLGDGCNACKSYVEIDRKAG